MNISFENKVVVITGAAGGIGKAMARRFAKDNAFVAVCDLRGASEAAAEIVKELGGNVKGYEFDITDREITKAAMANIAAEFGRIDVLINNAGINVGPDERKLPYLGIWMNNGEFQDIYTITPEPCTVPFDAPDRAAKRGITSVIAPREHFSFEIKITVKEDQNI